MARGTWISVGTGPMGPPLGTYMRPQKGPIGHLDDPQMGPHEPRDQAVILASFTGNSTSSKETLTVSWSRHTTRVHPSLDGTPSESPSRSWTSTTTPPSSRTFLSSLTYLPTWPLVNVWSKWWPVTLMAQDPTRTSPIGEDPPEGHSQGPSPI